MAYKYNIYIYKYKKDLYFININIKFIGFIKEDYMAY